MSFKCVYHNPEWLSNIKPRLQKMAQGNQSINEIFNHLEYFERLNIESKNDKIFSKDCSVLKQIYQGQIPKIYALIAQFLLKEVKLNIPIFWQGKQQYTFQKDEVIFIICMMSTFLVPRQEWHNLDKKYDKFIDTKHFGYIFSNSDFKTKTIIQYLKIAIKQAPKTKNQRLIIRRCVQSSKVQDLIQEKKDQLMALFTLEHDNVSIEDFYGMLKIDFANRYIGGGSLFSGCVQQQIMFANHPQLYISSLFCEVMTSQQSLIFFGFRKYFKNMGYGYQTSFNGLQNHQYKFQKNGVACQYISAIDALSCPGDYQFTKQGINRQILKAYVGFNVNEVCTVATGNWGCGAFRGDHQLKLVIQWIASSLCNKKIIYCPFGKQNLYKDLFPIFSKMTIGEVYKILITSQQQLKNGQLYLKMRIKD